MQSIWKLKLQALDRQTVIVPTGSKILNVQEQKGEVCIWFIVPNIENPVMVGRTFVIYGTGHSSNLIDENYIGTVQLQNGDLTFHIFEEI